MATALGPPPAPCRAGAPRTRAWRTQTVLVPTVVLERHHRRWRRWRSASARAEPRRVRLAGSGEQQIQRHMMAKNIPSEREHLAVGPSLMRCSIRSASPALSHLERGVRERWTRPRKVLIRPSRWPYARAQGHWAGSGGRWRACCASTRRLAAFRAGFRRPDLSVTRVCLLRGSAEGPPRNVDHPDARRFPLPSAQRVRVSAGGRGALRGRAASLRIGGNQGG